MHGLPFVCASSVLPWRSFSGHSRQGQARPSGVAWRVYGLFCVFHALCVDFLLLCVASSKGRCLVCFAVFFCVAFAALCSCCKIAGRREHGWIFLSHGKCCSAVFVVGVSSMFHVWRLDVGDVQVACAPCVSRLFLESVLCVGTGVNPTAFP